MKLHAPACETCGWHGKPTSEAFAAYALRRHSCRKWLDLAARQERAAQARAAVDKTPKPCRHKQAEHQHGTHACYVLDTCRCPPCTAAAATYERNRIRQAAYGRWRPFVDAEPVRAHVAQLRAAGIGLKRVALLTGVAHGTLWKLVYGVTRDDGTRRPTTRVRAETAQALLALQPSAEHLGSRVAIDPAGTQRRLRALVAGGWSQSQLARRLGMEPGNFNALIHGRRNPSTPTAAAVRDLYDRLWDQPPPQGDHRSKGSVTRARRYAAAHGWPPPLAWDDDTIDDPEATPMLPSDEKPGRRGRPRRIEMEDVEFLAGDGETLIRVADRLGVTADAVEASCRRNGRRDLLALLARNRLAREAVA